jgi:hypothetical protein
MEGGNKGCIRNFGREHWLDQEGDGRIISRWIERVDCEDGKWMELVLDLRVLLPGS